MKVPFRNLAAQHAPIREQLDAAIAEVIDSGAFASGPFVTRFEREFAAYCGSSSAVGVGSGTEALWLTLLALGIGAGDEVLTVPSTFMATAETISFCGARPAFADIDERTYTLDPSLIEQAITPRTKAIVPVHLFGQMADMDPILEIAARHGLPVIEDASQAHGARYHGRRAGTLGTAGCFSFYPGKNLGALGEAGAVVTNDPMLESKLKVLRDHGQTRKHCHTTIGWNARMDGIQGAVLSVKLRQLDAANAKRRAHAQQYGKLLEELDAVITPASLQGSEPVYHVYAVRVPNRDETLEELAGRGISCAIHYPTPVHMQEAYRGLGLKAGAFPVSERCAAEFLSLPMFPELREEQIRAVVAELKACLGKLKICAV